MTPVACTVEPKTLSGILLDHINGARRRRLGFRVKRDTRPVARIEHLAHGVFLDMVDERATWTNPGSAEDIEDKTRALKLILKVRCVDENQAIALDRNLHVTLQDVELIARVLV